MKWLSKERAEAQGDQVKSCSIIHCLFKGLLCHQIYCPLKMAVFFVYLKSLHIGVNSNKRELIYGPTKYNAEFLGVILSSFLDIINK